MAGHARAWLGRPIPVVIVLLVAAVGLAGCTRGADRGQLQASISVSPQAALVDQPVAVTVQSLPAGARTTLTARARDTERPAVLVFSGSGGGLTTSMAAALLAAHGYPSLALAYFEAPGLPQSLHTIPLEYFTRALRLLRAQPGVDPDHVQVAGESRGGEAALLLGAHFPQLVSGVIAGVPSSVVNPGERPDASKPAWTLGGRPLPAVSPSEFGRPDQTSNPRAVIPVERIRGPVLLTCGEQDRIWPSCAYVDAITVRLRAHRFAYPVTALRYPDAGHLIGGLTAWYGSLTDDALAGGTEAGTKAAQADAHTKMLALLASQ